MSKQCFQIIYWLESWEIPNPLSLTICMKIYCHWRHCTCCNHLLYSDYHLGKRRQQNYLQPCLQINIHVPAYYRTFHKHPNSKVQKPPSQNNIAFFTAVNHNYYQKQQTLKHRNTQNGSKSTDHITNDDLLNPLK